MIATIGQELTTDLELPELDQLRSCLELRLALQGRIANGTTFVANLLAASDAENPKYQLHKGRLEDLSHDLEANEAHIWLLWKRTNARVTLELPKQGLEHPLVVINDKHGAGFKMRPIRELPETWLYTVTYTEFRQLLAPFLFPDLEF